MDLKNITVEDLKEKLAAFDKKTLIKFGIGFGSIILFLIIYYAILNPMVKERKAKFEDKVLKQTEIKQMENDIISIRTKIKKMEPIVEKNSTLFHSKEEVEGLYQSLSRFAGAFGLVISKIEKQKPKPVLKPGVAQQAEDLLQASQISYYKIPVLFEIKGNFLSYIKFKRAVSRSKKMLNFDNEMINVVQNDKNGSIIASGELTIVGLPNEFFKIILTFIFLMFSSIVYSDNHDLNQIAQEIQEEEEVPLNDPFAGNEGTTGSLDATVTPEEQEDVMSLVNFKLSGLISGKDNSYITLVNSSGENITLTIGQYLGKIKLVDLRLTEAIFEKDDKTFIMIDFNNTIREADEY